MSHDTVYAAIYESPIGRLGIYIKNTLLTSITWLEVCIDYKQTAATPVSTTVIEALVHYFQNPDYKFNVPISLTGTSFQKRIWQRLMKIQSGQVKTYGEIATELDTSSRAVGQACRRNRIPIVIPCHRVVAAKDVGGFMGDPLQIHVKEWLLQHECIH